MNCVYHPNLWAVGTCADCRVGLCATCVRHYDFPICVECNRRRIATERRQIRQEFFLMAIGAAAVIYVMNESPGSPQNTTAFAIQLSFSAYVGAAIVAGWRALSHLTANTFLFLPLVGWAIYLFLKIALAWIIGPFVLPVRLFRNVRRLRGIPVG